MASGHTSRYFYNDVDDFDEALLDEAFQDIINKPSWKISFVSPLHNLQYSEVKLKQYAGRLKRMLTESVSENSSVRYKATFVKDPKLKLQADHPDAIKITVTACKSDDDGANYYVAYEAVMMSWGVCTSTEYKTHLPYLLDRGSVALTKSVRAVLTKLFDCYIKNFSFTQSNLLLFNAVFAMLAEQTGGSCVSYIYTLLHSKIRQKVSVKLDVASLKRLWNSVCTEEPEEMVFSRKNILALQLYQNFQNHVHNRLNMDIAMMDLVEIHCPKASVKVGGVIRMKEASVVRSFLKTLNDIMPNIFETNDSNSDDGS